MLHVIQAQHATTAPPMEGVLIIHLVKQTILREVIIVKMEHAKDKGHAKQTTVMQTVIVKQTLESQVIVAQHAATPAILAKAPTLTVRGIAVACVTEAAIVKQMIPQKPAIVVEQNVLQTLANAKMLTTPNRVFATEYAPIWLTWF